jgi:hypothetical protein
MHAIPSHLLCNYALYPTTVLWYPTQSRVGPPAKRELSSRSGTHHVAVQKLEKEERRLDFGASWGLPHILRFEVDVLVCAFGSNAVANLHR